MVDTKIKCQFYPCHFEGQDCSFCYCPLYPCRDTKLGSWYKDKWDCSKCTIMHKTTFIWIIHRFIRHMIEIWRKK